MKRIIPIILAILFLVPALSSCGYEFVEPGEVGIRIDKVGERREVDNTDVVVGRVFFNPWSTGVIRYPTRVERIVWTRDQNEGSSTNEEIDFNTAEGLRLTADVALSAAVESECAPELYNTFKQPLESLIDGTIRDIVRENIRSVSSQMVVEDIIGTGSVDFANRAEAGLREELSAMCIRVQDFSILGTIRVPDSVAAEIQNKISAEQEAMTEEERIRTAEAIAEQARATARGEADAAIIAAEGEAQALTLVGNALDENPNILQLRYIERWDGVLPRFQAGGGELPSFIVPLE